MSVVTAFEHETLRVGDRLTAGQLDALQAFHGAAGTPAFSLVHRGIRTGSTVGVVQLGTLTLEILPKADRGGDEGFWRGRLVDMLRVVTRLPLRAPTESRLALRPGTVLHLYFELLARECEALVRRGLVRQYRRHRSDSTALRGRLLVTEQVRRHHVHRERFACERDVYDREHEVHRVLSSALARVGRLDTSGLLRGRLAALRLDFPEAAPLTVTPALFERLSPKLTTRKLAPYARAIHIARLVLLSLHPDLRGGREPVLALLFDMNALWEGFLAAALRRHLPPGARVSAQASTPFWAGDDGPRVSLRPDLIVAVPGGQRIGLDAKWKYFPDQPKPSPADLRQLYAYADYFGCDATALVYPGDWGTIRGAFLAGSDGFAKTNARANLLAIPTQGGSLGTWMGAIATAATGLLPVGQTSR